MKPFTLLFSSAGRRVGLIDCFRRSLQAAGASCRVLAADLEPEWSAACQLADACFAVPRIADSDFVPALLSLCESEQVDVVVPTLDPELPLFAEARAAFGVRGTEMLVSDPTLCGICGSKRKSAETWLNLGFQTPEILKSPESYDGPMFAKRNQSSASAGATQVMSPAHLACLRSSGEDLVFQPWVEGEEFTVDLYVDREGSLHDWVARRRVEVRSGEISKGETYRDADVTDLVQRLIPQLKGARGPLTLQVIREKGSGELWIIEINARFGGGFPLSFANGMDVPLYLLHECRGEPLPDPSEHPVGLRMLRFDAEKFMKNGCPAHSPSI